MSHWRSLLPSPRCFSSHLLGSEGAEEVKNGLEKENVPEAKYSSLLPLFYKFSNTNLQALCSTWLSKQKKKSKINDNIWGHSIPKLCCTWILRHPVVCKVTATWMGLSQTVLYGLSLPMFYSFTGHTANACNSMMVPNSYQGISFRNHAKQQ